VTLATSFSDYPVDSLPAILLGPDWTDNLCWHNDACPVFVHVPTGIAVWAQYPDDAMRDCPGGDRFAVVQLVQGDHGWEHDLDNTDTSLVEIDDADTLTRALPHYMGDGFARFQATGRDHADLGVPTSDEGLDGIPGRTYCGTLYLTQNADQWHCIIGNCEWSGTLVDMERRLFRFAVTEGYMDDLAQVAA
jgi:hypothetical protein